MKSLYLLGSGGFGAEIYSFKNFFNKSYSIITRVDKNPISEDILSQQVFLEEKTFSKSEEFFISIGDLKARSKLFEICLEKQNLSPASIFFPNIYLSDDLDLSSAKGLIIMPNSSIAARTAVGNNVHIHGGAIIGHDVMIGSNVNIGARAFLGGGVSIGNNVDIFPGALIAPSVNIGNQVKIGIGSVILRDVPSNSTMLGNPAKKIG